MQLEGGVISISVIWRGKRFVVEMSQSASLNELGQELLKLTSVSEDTMRLLMPKSSASGSKVLYPFGDEHSQLSLQEASIMESKDIRMMGATKEEVDEIIKNEKANLRIAGFEEEERRLRQRMSTGPQYPLKLPQGTYIFCEFRTLDLPGVKLNPPPSEALKRLHRLAADPGIVAVMNKHRWRVGVMSEMAPEGYVGISSVCILGYNKNQGEEISLRLRTDDLKGFRKYEVIKKTLLHELAHMVHSEHDANFHALNSQLNKEASDLDWTKSRSHTLSGSAFSAHYDEEFDIDDYGSTSRKLGGNTSGLLMSARSSSVAAAYNRMASESVSEGKDTDASLTAMDGEHRSNVETKLVPQIKADCNSHLDGYDNETQSELRSVPDPSVIKGNAEFEPYDDSQAGAPMSNIGTDKVTDKDMFARANTSDELDQNKAKSKPNGVIGLEDSLDGYCLSNRQNNGHVESEPDPDDSSNNGAAPNLHSVQLNNASREIMNEPNLGRQGIEIHNKGSDMSDEIDIDQERGTYQEPDPCISETLTREKTEVNLNDSVPIPMDIYVPDPDDEEMQRIQDPVMNFCHRLQTAVDSLCSEVKSGNAEMVLKTLSKIISNAIEHPNEVKFKRLRKANPAFAKNIASYKAAMEILSLIGFQEDTVPNDIGSLESFLVLKRNDPGLLWLAKSSLEAYSSQSKTKAHH